MKKTIRMAIIGEQCEYAPEFIYRSMLLDRDRFDVVIDMNDPDYVLVMIAHVVYQREILERLNAIYDDRKVFIFWGNEAISPDMNLFDYALTLDNSLSMQDRICWRPNRVYYAGWDDIMRGNPFSGECSADTAAKLCSRKFCNFIYSNPYGHPMRTKLYEAVSRYRRVDSLGRYLHNVPESENRWGEDWFINSVEKKRGYKFSIAAENACFPGYTSEKIISSFLANTIPIYWGNPDISLEFNPRAFIDCTSMSLPEVVELVEKMDRDDDLYLEMLSQPWQTPDQIRWLDERIEEYRRFCDSIFSRDLEDAKRINFGTAVKRYQRFFFEGSISNRFRIDDPDRFRGSRIVLYGAGNVGRDYYAQLSVYNDIHICAWVDAGYFRYHYPYCEVLSPEALEHIEYDRIIIAVQKEVLAESIKDDLVSRGVDPDAIYWSSPAPMDDISGIYDADINSVWMRGGLGNQMFQYAFCRALQEHGHRSLLCLDDFAKYFRPYELESVFPGVIVEPDSTGVFMRYKDSFTGHTLYREKGDSLFDPNVFAETDASFRGFWQTEKYFADIADRIRQELKFDVKDDRLQHESDSIRSHRNTVSVHIRRGDYEAEPFLICLSSKYYSTAIRYMTERLDDPYFVVFSDDMAWVKAHSEELFGDELSADPAKIEFMDADQFDDYHDWYDMYLMTCCDHNIIANSSFSWWGAWLNPNPDKIVIAPKAWEINAERPDICPDSWIRIGE